MGAYTKKVVSAKQKYMGGTLVTLECGHVIDSKDLYRDYSSGRKKETYCGQCAHDAAKAALPKGGKHGRG